MGFLRARLDIRIDIGPTRHGSMRCQATYFLDSSGAGAENFGKGLSYDEQEVVRVLSAFIPD